MCYWVMGNTQLVNMFGSRRATGGLGRLLHFVFFRFASDYEIAI